MGIERKPGRGRRRRSIGGDATGKMGVGDGLARSGRGWWSWRSCSGDSWMGRLGIRRSEDGWGKNGEVEEFVGKREREEMVGQEEEIVGGEIVGEGVVDVRGNGRGKIRLGENLEVRGGAVR